MKYKKTKILNYLMRQEITQLMLGLLVSVAKEAQQPCKLTNRILHTQKTKLFEKPVVYRYLKAIKKTLSKKKAFIKEKRPTYQK